MTITVHGVTTLLQVFDMPKSISFYRDVLGFKVAATSEPANDFHWALLTSGDASLMLNTAYDDGERPPTPDPARNVGHADTVLYFNCASVDDVYAHLLSKGWKASQPSTASYGMRQVYIEDPDGFQLCFQHPAN